MPFLRPNDPLTVTVIDGTNMTLIAPLEVRTRGGRLLRARAGSTTDGLSAPKFAKLDIQDSETFEPAVMHDAAYRDSLEESADGGATWQPVTLSKTESDALLYELLQDNGVGEDIARLLFVAVAEFGQPSFEADRKNMAAVTPALLAPKI